MGAKEKTLLTEIVNDSSVYVYFDVSERDLLMLLQKIAEDRNGSKLGQGETSSLSSVGG